VLYTKRINFVTVTSHRQWSHILHPRSRTRIVNIRQWVKLNWKWWARGRTATSNGQTCGLPQSLFDVRLAINRELKVNSDERKLDEPGLEHIKTVGRDRICWNTSNNLIATLERCSNLNKMSAMCRQLYHCQSSLLVSVSCSRYNVWEVKPNTWLAHKISVAVSVRNIQCS